MRGRYSKLIEDFCQENDIIIPFGFYRRSASRYVIIEVNKKPPKLVARTWSHMEDVVYYIKNFVF